MKKYGIILLVMAFLLAPAMAQAVQFSIVGPRALGMGGANVAAVNDSTAVYWNPAALADFRKVDIRVPVSAALRDHVGLKDTVDRINEIHALVLASNTAAINETIDLLNHLNKPNTGADIDASAGLLVSIPFSKSAIAVSALGLGYAGLYPTIDTTNMSSTPAACPSTFVGCNNSTVTGTGIVGVEPTVSFATQFTEKLYIGANAKMIKANTYLYAQTITSGDFSNFTDNLDNSKTASNKAAVDAGILFVVLGRGDDEGATAQLIDAGPRREERHKSSFREGGNLGRNLIGGNVDGRRALQKEPRLDSRKLTPARHERRLAVEAHQDGEGPHLAILPPPAARPEYRRGSRAPARPRVRRAPST